jgi:AcrR family transcriptional regulator
MENTTQKPMPTASELRRERERAELTERIMNVARDMFVNDGYEAVTLRRIAKAIEYSPAAIYQYFKDKQDLVLAIIRRDYQDLRAHLFECLKMKSPLERSIEMAYRYVAWGRKHPNHYRLLMVPHPSWSETQSRIWAQDAPPLERDALILLKSFVEDAIRRDMLKEQYTDATAIAATLWAGLHGLVLLEITMGTSAPFLPSIDTSTFDNRFNMMIQVFKEGLMKDPPP